MGICSNIYDSPITRILTLLYTGNPLTGTFTNSEDLDEMPHNAAFHQGLHCLLYGNRSISY